MARFRRAFLVVRFEDLLSELCVAFLLGGEVLVQPLDAALDVSVLAHRLAHVGHLLLDIIDAGLDDKLGTRCGRLLDLLRRWQRMYEHRRFAADAGYELHSAISAGEGFAALLINYPCHGCSV